MGYDIPSILEAVDLRKAWTLLGLPGIPKLGAQKSPFRDEKRPSFSIFAGFRKWKDHGTDDKGDVIDFWMKATGKSKGDSIKELAGLAGVKPEEANVLPMRRLRPMFTPKPGQYEKFEPKLDRIECSRRLYDELTYPGYLTKDLEAWFKSKQITRDTVFALATCRRIGLTSQGQLCFFFENGTKIRRVLDDAHSSIWEKGSRADVPWRIEDVPAKAVTILLCEGESDHMRLLSVIPKWAGYQSVSVVSMPSASWRPTPAQAYRLAAARNVVLLTDADDAGNCAAAALSAIFEAEANGCRVWRPSFPAGSDCCTLSDEFLLKSFDSMKRLV